MEKMRISLSSEEIDLFERRRTDAGMSKSSFVRLLLAEHENKVISSIKYKDIISALSDINTTLKEILISEQFDLETKLILDEKIKTITALVNEKMKT